MPAARTGRRVEPMSAFSRPQLGPFRWIVVVVAAAPVGCVGREARRSVEAVNASHQPLRVVVAERARSTTVVIVTAA